jgi:2-keto-4-pentenoate hydratase/2-oxohepta-3-ene-1,7-dioic acid hydratase in catechol pathway
VISTGTPEGVIFGMDPKNWMKPGDEYVVEVEGLGKLTNKMVEA